MRALLVMLAVPAFLQACDGGSEPSGQPTLHDHIVFVSNRTCCPQLHQMRLDGSGIRAIPQDGLLRPFEPQVSPNGEWIAFGDQFGDVWVQRVDGSESRNLIHGAAECGSPMWSPGGERLALRCLDSPTDDGDLWAVQADGSAFVPLTDDPAEDSRPSWSPTGDRIAFYSNRDGNWDVYVLDVATRAVVNLTDDPDSDEQLPRWSPDGRWIAYVTDAPPLPVSHTRALELIEVTTGATRRLYTQAESGPFVAWAPDSRSLIFSRRDVSPDEGDIVSLDIETQALTVILPPDGFVDERPAYGPSRFGF